MAILKDFKEWVLMSWQTLHEWEWVQTMNFYEVVAIPARSSCLLNGVSQEVTGQHLAELQLRGTGEAGGRSCFSSRSICQQEFWEFTIWVLHHRSDPVCCPSCSSRVLTIQVEQLQENKTEKLREHMQFKAQESQWANRSLNATPLLY